MTLEELKIEAKKHGYHLVKDNVTVKLLSCPVCGSKRTIERISMKSEGYRRECSKCGFNAGGSWRKTKKEARESWNEAVLDYEKGELNELCNESL